MCNYRSNIIQTDALVKTNTEVMPGIFIMWLNCPPVAVTVRPGQFVMLSCGRDNLLRRPFSVHRIDEEGGYVAILYAIVGKGTQWLADCRSGYSINLLGPLGNGFSIDDKADNLLLIAGGMGVAPLVFLSDEACHRGKKTTLLMGSTSTDTLCPTHLIDSEVNYHTITEDGSCGNKGLVTQRLAEFAPNTEQVFACGPLSMYRTLATEPILKNRMVQVSLEVRMACGFGSCYGCSIKTREGIKQVCNHGPIFDIKDILWDDLAEI